MTKAALKGLLAPAGLLLAAFLAFGLTLRAGFLWDDHRMIVENPRLGMTAANLAAAFRGDPFGQGLNYYRPLQTVSNMADFAAWGLRPFGFHLTNFLFHAATAVLFFYLALALGFARPAAFWAAALLAAHPAAVEQMLVIAGRAELASSACAAASLLLYLRGRKILSFFLFLAACGFKENGVVTPALAALCLWYRGAERRDYKGLAAFFAFVPVYLLLRHQALGMGLFSHGAGAALAGLFTKVPSSVAAYLASALLPFDMHSHRLQPDLAWLRWAAPALLAGGGWLLLRRGGRLGLFCAGWYLLNLAPKLPLLAANDLMLDHWVYLANAGLFLAAAELALRGRDSRAALPLALAALTLASALNIPKRDTDLEIYEHAALRSSSKPMLYNLAREYYIQGRALKSRLLLERLAAADPANAQYLDGLALARSAGGDHAGALAAADAALALRPGDPELRLNRRAVLLAGGRRKEASAELAAIVKEFPGFYPALLALARELAAARRDGDAEFVFRKAAAANPAGLEALNDLGILLGKAGRYAEAEEFFLRAVALRPGGAAESNLALARSMKSGRPAPSGAGPAAR